jgi:hypothetical protein
MLTSDHGEEARRQHAEQRPLGLGLILVLPAPGQAVARRQLQGLDLQAQALEQRGAQTSSMRSRVSVCTMIWA